MVPHMGVLLCGDTGHALNNFKIAAGLNEGEHKGMFWHDGDFYKWLEALLHVYAQNGDKALLEKIDEYIEIIGKAQESDGYLQTQVQLRSEVDRYVNRKYHEMYNTGHLLTCACVHYQITGQRNFLDIAIKQADLLYTLFFPETNRFCRFGFNQTQIMGLVELYRITKDKRYLALAERFINRRGRYPVEHHSSTHGYPIGDMVQERTPLREATEAVGHAVLALYFYCGAADVFAETGEKTLITALTRLWDNVTQKKMYVTGAVGQAHYGASTDRDKIEEGFIDDYMLPNMTAYNETCANVCNAMFSYRMMHLHGEAKYAEIIELVLFNSALSGIGINGKEYFYANPLRMIHNSRAYHAHENATETPNREPYLECFCCPPNLVRTIAKSSKWAYSISDHGLVVNLYGGNELTTKLADGSPLKLTQSTDYPWEGDIMITLTECKDTPFEICLRIPEWAFGATVTINNSLIKDGPKPGFYYKVLRKWKAGDEIKIDLPMEIQFLEGHPRIEEVRNQVAVKRGPIVYCVESPDLPDGTDILDVYISANEEFTIDHDPSLLGGITTINTNLYIRRDTNEGTYRVMRNPIWERHQCRLVPYFAWSNRGLSEMTVFMPVLLK